MARRLKNLLVVPIALMIACSGVGRASHTSTGADGIDSSQQRAAGGENDDTTTARLNALQEARSAGTFGAAATQLSSPFATPGWTGEQLMNRKTDDWEPAVATDPNAPYIYILTTRYGQPKTCSSHCPTPYLALMISSDNGATWGPQVPLWGAKGSKAQYDPTIEVSPASGVVNALFLNADRAGGYSAVFTRSTDHGANWTDPVHVYKKSWTDKPEVTTSPSGKDVYVSWNGQTGGDLWVAASHDHGVTWTQTRVVSSKRYFYAYDAKVLPDGTVIFAESSLLYTGHVSHGGAVSGTVWHHAIISLDKGATWYNVVVDKVPVGEACVAAGCSPDFYLGQASVASDAHNKLVFAYEGPATNGAPQRIFVRTSTDDGFRWSGRTALSVAGEDATGPRVAATGRGDMRIWYMQTSGNDNADAWNVWYRSSTDGGASWSAPERLSDAPAGAAGYVHAKGFDEIYGDYGEIGITSRGKTVAVWGEGLSYDGPGGTWYDIQT